MVLRCLNTRANLVLHSNGIGLPDHLATGQLLTIQIPDKSSIQIPTVIRNRDETHFLLENNQSYGWAK